MRKNPSTKLKSGEVKLTASSFEALSDEVKNRIYAQIESQAPEERLAESRPLNKAERAQWRAFKKRAAKSRSGRPKIGRGSQVISLSIEKNLLRRADAYAKREGLGRSEMFIKALGGLIGADK